MRSGFYRRRGKNFTRYAQAARTFYPDVWDVFGGYCNPGESRGATLRRELFEELGITPTGWKFLLTVDEPNPAENGAGRYHIDLVTAFDGEPQNLQQQEHAFTRWLEFEEALNLPNAPPLYAAIIAQIEQMVK